MHTHGGRAAKKLKVFCFFSSEKKDACFFNGPGRGVFQQKNLSHQGTKDTKGVTSALFFSGWLCGTKPHPNPSHTCEGIREASSFLERKEAKELLFLVLARAWRARARRHIWGMGPVFVGSEIYRNSTYGKNHPLAVPRVSSTTDLCRALGWLTDANFVEAPMASFEQVTRFHDPAYIEALKRAEDTQSVSEDDRTRFHIGAYNNPVYPEIFRRPMTSAGGILLAARLTRDGGIVYAPGGGTHHGRPDRASGFCYLNDPVLGMLAWLDQGLTRIAYVDIDAHHGDGVQDAFAGDPRVLTISVHEANRWPHTGAAADRAGGSARNFPVPPGFNDTELRHLLHHAILPLLRAHAPQAIFLQCGADALEEDPLSRLGLSNNAHWGVVAALRNLAPRVVVTGGGGYNPWTVARCWAGVWATLNGFVIPATLPPAAEAVLRDLRFNRAAGRNPPDHWFTTLRDTPREGMVRPEILALPEPSA
jgi:acetoin utilization protein AcuC